VDIAVRRWQAFTGDHARHAETGRTFTDLEAGRRGAMPDDNQAGGKTGYEVGYGKPPAGSRFVKGKSGNPRGKPKGSKNLATLIAKTAGETVTVQENGRRKTITKLEAMTKQLVNKAASGEPRATQLLLQMIQMYEDRPGTAAQTDELEEADRMVMDQLVARFNRLSQGGSGDGNTGPS
jgi:Family of unknown function (DUF5681)